MATFYILFRAREEVRAPLGYLRTPTESGSGLERVTDLGPVPRIGLDLAHSRNEKSLNHPIPGG